MLRIYGRKLLMIFKRFCDVTPKHWGNIELDKANISRIILIFKATYLLDDCLPLILEKTHDVVCGAIAVDNS